MSIQRREFLKTTATIAAGQILSVGPFVSPKDAAAELNGDSRLEHRLADVNPSVRPIIGCGWRGHVFPGAVAPFGFVQASPDTSGPPERKWNERGDYSRWEHCSGYHYPDNVILGFSHTHLQGTGGVDLGDILLMPLVRDRNWSWEPGIPDAQAEMQYEALGPDSSWQFDKQVPGYRSYFRHDREFACAGYYSVHLDTPDVFAELTATTRCALHRYTYPKKNGKSSQGMLIDLFHSLGTTVTQANLRVESNQRIVGHRATRGWAKDRHVYFAMEFSRPARVIDVNADRTTSKAMSGSVYSGTVLRAIASFDESAEPLLVRVGISATSIEGASRNLSAELGNAVFEAVAERSANEWKRVRSRIEGILPGHSLSEIFDTAVYHSLTAPATFCDVDKAYRGQDGENHSDPGFTNYTTLSVWDIYRGQFPFIMLAEPERTSDIVRTLLNDYKQLNLHALPMWPLWANETWSMTGFHAAGMILGAYTRGAKGFDIEEAYEAIRDTALQGAEARGNRELQESFRNRGYVPADQRGGSVSSTLDLSYDYWCAGTLAQLLGKDRDAELLLAFATNYKNVFDRATGFMRPKDKSGKWREPFRPDEEYEDYVETDAWQATFGVPHDVAGLIELFGGDEEFIAKLDGLFTAPSLVINGRPDITGMIGQDAQGNEPSNHIPYLYSFAGAPWKTQQWVRKVAEIYRSTPEGIPGNDDCGQLSSWFAFTALGFYPVNAATGVYVIGSPLVTRASIRVAEGRSFSIIAGNNSASNIFIQRAELNGRELLRSWITHEEIVRGGELHFWMSDRPNKEWGKSATARPPSGLAPENAKQTGIDSTKGQNA